MTDKNINIVKQMLDECDVCNNEYKFPLDIDNDIIISNFSNINIEDMPTLSKEDSIYLTPKLTDRQQAILDTLTGKIPVDDGAKISTRYGASGCVKSIYNDSSIYGLFPDNMPHTNNGNVAEIFPSTLTFMDTNPNIQQILDKISIPINDDDLMKLTTQWGSYLSTGASNITPAMPTLSTMNILDDECLRNIDTDRIRDCMSDSIRALNTRNSASIDMDFSDTIMTTPTRLNFRGVYDTIPEFNLNSTYGGYELCFDDTKTEIVTLNDGDYIKLTTSNYNMDDYDDMEDYEVEFYTLHSILNSNGKSVIDYLIEKGRTELLNKVFKFSLYSKFRLDRDEILKLFSHLDVKRYSITRCHPLYITESGVLNLDAIEYSWKEKSISFKHKDIIDKLSESYTYGEYRRLQSSIENNRVDIFKSIIAKKKHMINFRYIVCLIEDYERYDFAKIYGIEISKKKRTERSLSQLIKSGKTWEMINVLSNILDSKENGYLIEAYNKRYKEVPFDIHHMDLSSSKLYHVDKLINKDEILNEYILQNLYDDRVAVVELLAKSINKINLMPHKILQYESQQKREYVTRTCQFLGIINDVVLSDDIGSRRRCSIYDIKYDRIICGCFSGTLDEFINKVGLTYNKGDYTTDRDLDILIDYTKFIELCKNARSDYNAKN
jgi:hypothetical protein